MRDDAHRIAKEYSDALAASGDTLHGVGWPNASDVPTRYEVLLRPIDLECYESERRVRLLDLGCGPGFLLDYLAKNDLLARVEYTGVDIAEAALRSARRRWPLQRFEHRDVRDQPFPCNAFDYCMICGVFTSRCSLAFGEMREFVETTLRALWPSVELGIGFNVMSKHVDWEREDLFHWPLDDMMAFCKTNLSRHVSFRLDYGLWEAATFVFRAPAQRCEEVPKAWRAQKNQPLDPA